MSSTRAAALSLALLLSAAPAPAQETSWVLPRGMAALEVGLQYTHFGSRFVAGGTMPLGAPLSTPLTPTTFGPLVPLQTELNRFLAATEPAGGGVRADADDLTLGALDVAAAADVREVPMVLRVGVLARVEVGIEVPVYRTDLRLERLALTGATVGINRNPAANRAALARLGAQYGALGESVLLPLAGTPLGDELTRRVTALGGSIELPAAAADTLLPGLLNQLLAEQLGVAMLESGTSPWRLGDAQLHAAVRVLDSFGGAPFPADSTPLAYRLAVQASVRLPTGAGSDTVKLIPFGPPVGVTGWGAGAVADLFLADRWWLTAATHFRAHGEVEVVRRVADPAAPLLAGGAPAALRWKPPTELSLRLAPRFRLHPAIALGAIYELAAVGESSFAGAEGAAVMGTDGGVVQRLGGSVRYSTVAAGVGESSVPLEVSLGFRTTVAGPGGVERRSTLTAQLSVLRRLWGDG